MIWKETMLNDSETLACRFNNSRVFDTITSHNREYDDPLIYLPIREYCQNRFIRHIEIIGADNVIEIFANILPGTRPNITFSSETRVLAFLIGLRETGLPLAQQNRVPRRNRYFRRGRSRYIRNFGGSGLDNMGSGFIQSRVSRFLIRGTRRQVFRDDPNSDDPSDIGIRQRNIHTVFAAYFRHQAEFHLASQLPSINDRLIRYFWRALTFGGQGGSDWQSSRAGGRNSLLTLFRLLNMHPNQVSKIWNETFIRDKLLKINDKRLLRKLAREENSRTRRNDIPYWQNRAIHEISIGLRTARYTQAMKLAAIAEAFSVVLSHDFYR